MQDRLHPSHVTRASFDSSSYDEVCINCGAVDIAAGGWGALAFPCPNEVHSIEDTWKEYANDFNAMTDEEVEAECRYEQRRLDEAESWLEAVELWKRAGKPRDNGKVSE